MNSRYLLLAIIMFVGLIVRLYNFNSPMTDLHSWRQSDTASVARNLSRNNINVLYPKIDSFVSIDGVGRDNSFRYHFAEFPIYQALVAIASYMVGNVVVAGRLVSIAFSLLSIIVLYGLCSRFFGIKVSLLSAFVYSLIPYNIYWSRTVLPDSMMVAMCLLMLYCFVVAVQTNKNVYYVLAFIFLSVALLLKVFVVFLFVPVIYLIYRKFGNSFWKKKYLWIGLFASVLPFISWRLWMSQWPMSIPASGWLLNGNFIRLKPSWWHWLFQERIDMYMFNFSGLIFIGIACLFYRTVLRELSLHKIFEKSKSYVWFWMLCLFSIFLYLVVFATGNVQHEYYQLPIVPFGCVFVALGFWYAWGYEGPRAEKLSRRIASVMMLVIMFMLGWYSVKGWYTPSNPLVVAVGERADKILPSDAKVIADYGGNTTLLYYVNRPGWSVREKQVQQLINQGATHYISMHRNDYMNKLAKLYRVVDETSEYVILDLRTREGNWEGIGEFDL
ncbi:MAG: glycosyltransferase family 39 protein [bacterium]|nr:glycosyltransferase family 39 protein [bacterium]